MFIVLEGIDGSGKSTTSKALAKALNCRWTKEPTFTSEQADALNLGSKNDVEREVEFAIDRIRHMGEVIGWELSSGDSIVCDRYIWSGLAYCTRYNPAAYPFAEALYKHPFFIKPDVYVLVDTPVAICSQRKQDQPIDHLRAIRNAYIKTRPIVEKDSRIIEVQGVGKIEDSVAEIRAALG